MLGPVVPPGTRSVAALWKATKRPLALSEAPFEPLLPVAVPVALMLTSSAARAGPLPRSGVMIRTGRTSKSRKIIC